VLIIRYASRADLKEEDARPIHASKGWHFSIIYAKIFLEGRTMANSERFEIDLPNDLAQFVHSQVGEGALASDADVVREAVRVMQRQASKLAELRAMVKASLDDPRPSLTDDEVGEHLRQRAAALRGARGEHA